MRSCSCGRDGSAVCQACGRPSCDFHLWNSASTKPLFDYFELKQYWRNFQGQPRDIALANWRGQTQDGRAIHLECLSGSIDAAVIAAAREVMRAQEPLTFLVFVDCIGVLPSEWANEVKALQTQAKEVVCQQFLNSPSEAAQVATRLLSDLHTGRLKVPVTLQNDVRKSVQEPFLRQEGSYTVPLDATKIVFDGQRFIEETVSEVTTRSRFGKPRTETASTTRLIEPNSAIFDLIWYERPGARSTGER